MKSASRPFREVRDGTSFRAGDAWKRNPRPLCRLGGGEGVTRSPKEFQSLREKSETRLPDMLLPESDEDLDDFLSCSDSHRSSDDEDGTDL